MSEQESLSALEYLNYGDDVKENPGKQQIIAYFAGSFGRKGELQTYRRWWEEAGNICTSRWLATDHEVDFQDDVDQLRYEGEGYNFAIEDVDDIRRSEAVVFFSSKNHESKGRGGRHTEFGICLGLELPVFLIGEPECAFHATVQPHRRFADWSDFANNYAAVATTVLNYREAIRPLYKY
jgi:hypothetical protein